MPDFGSSLCAANSCLFTLVAMFRTGYAASGLSRAHSLVLPTRRWKSRRVLVCSVVNRFGCCVIRVCAVSCAFSSLGFRLLNVAVLKPEFLSHLSVANLDWFCLRRMPNWACVSLSLSCFI